ncbi:MAG: DUF4143 domain-containing protein [Spirochaetia bacterium]
MNDKTIRSYIDILTATYMVRPVQPWHVNLKKRQVKSPKIYISDTGILHHLLGLRDMEDLLGRPQLGASWESEGRRQRCESIFRRLPWGRTDRSDRRRFNPASHLLTRREAIAA